MTRPGRACPTTSRRESTTDRLAILPWPGAPSRQRRRECRMRLDALAPSVSRGRAGKPPCPVNVKHPRARATGTIASPATGSAHHQPTRAFRTRPTSRIADKYAHRSVCRESAASAALESAVATRRFARASHHDDGQCCDRNANRARIRLFSLPEDCVNGGWRVRRKRKATSRCSTRAGALAVRKERGLELR